MEDKSGSGEADSKLEVKEETWWQQNASNALLEKQPEGANKTEIKEEPVWLKSEEWETYAVHVKTEVKQEPASCTETQIKDNEMLITGMDDLWAAQSPRSNTEAVYCEAPATSEKQDCSDKVTTREQEVDGNDTRGKHNFVHKVKKCHTCDICGKVFKHSSHFKEHVLRHGAIRSYKCEICDKGFKALSNLRKHTVIHENKRPYICGMCQKAFKLASELKRHFLIHEGNKPHNCKVCDRSYFKVSDLKDHIMVHEGRKPLKCNICEKSFRWRSQFRTHKLRHGTADSTQV